MALTKAEMAERLFLDVGLNKREAKEFVDAYFEVVREALERGEQVKLSGFGNFDLRQKNQRPGRWFFLRRSKLPKPDSFTCSPLSNASRTTSK